MKYTFIQALIILTYFGLFFSYTSYSQCSTTLTPGSSIVDETQQELIGSWLPTGFEFEADLIWNSEVSGSSANLVHAAVDGLSNTLLIAVSEQGYIYGGYNEGVWNSDGLTQTGLDNNFLFSVSFNEIYPAIPGEIHITNSTSGLTFGNGLNDLSFATSSTSEVICRNYLGNSYECPSSASNCTLYLNNNLGWNNLNDRFLTVRWELWQLNTSGEPTVEGLLGCTDSEAINYDSEAQCDDESCIYVGCTNPLASNYDPSAQYDDGSCLNVSSECGDGYCLPQLSVGCNSDYNDLFITSDGLVNIEHETSGCSGSSNYDFYIEHRLVTQAGQEIEYEIWFPDFDQYYSIAVDLNQNLAFEEDEFLVIAHVSRTEFGGGTFLIPADALPGTYQLRVQNYYDLVDFDTNTIQCLNTTYGEVQDYPLTIVDDSEVGCTYPQAENFLGSAVYDDGSCIIVAGCPGDFNGDSEVNVQDIGGFLGSFGASCE